MTIYIGIDPGKTGALAAVNGSGESILVVDLPWIGKDVDIQAVRDHVGWARARDRVVACVEYQQAFPGQGAVSAYTLGEGVGQIKGLLLGLDVPFDEVRPAKWKVALELPAKAEKDKSRMLARRLFPHADLGTRKDQGRSDALLIAEYRRRQER